MAISTFVVTCIVVVLIRLAVIDDLSFVGLAIPCAIAAGASWMTYEFARGRHPFDRSRSQPGTVAGRLSTGRDLVHRSDAESRARRRTDRVNWSE